MNYTDEKIERQFKGVWIPKEIWLDSRLSALDKVIFAEIDSYSSTENGCFISNDKLAEFCQCSTSKVSKTISKLTKYGYIKVLSFDGRKRYLQSCLVNFTMQDNKKCYSANQNMLGSKYNNINNNIDNNINYIIPLNPPMGDNPENEQKKESTSKKKVDFDSIFREYTQDKAVIERLYDWLEIRKAKRIPNTESAIRKNLQKLSSIAKESNMNVIEYLDAVIMRGWAAFYPINEWKQQSNNNTKQIGTKVPDDSAYDIDHFFE